MHFRNSKCYQELAFTELRRHNISKLLSNIKEIKAHAIINTGFIILFNCKMSNVYSELTIKIKICAVIK